MNFTNHNGTKEFNPCDLYNWRLDWLENQIAIRHGRGEKLPEEQYQRWFTEEERVYQNNLRDYKKIERLNKDICIVVPTHFYHSVWLRACLESCKKTGYFIILAYDNPLYQENQKVSDRFPSTKTLMMADYISIKHKSWGSGVGIPHSWNMWYALHAAKSFGFKYVFNLNGDCIMEKADNFDELIQILGDKDIISCEYHKDRYLGTMAYLGKIDPLIEMWDMNLKNLYRYNIGNAEARMGQFAAKLNLKIVDVENPEDHHFKPPGVKGTFRKVLGIRHLHAEHKVRRWDKLEPVDEKYCDKQYLNGHERNTLLKYWQTGNKKFLKEWLS